MSDSDVVLVKADKVQVRLKENKLKDINSSEGSD